MDRSISRQQHFICFQLNSLSINECLNMEEAAQNPLKAIYLHSKMRLDAFLGRGGRQVNVKYRTGPHRMRSTHY